MTVNKRRSSLDRLSPRKKRKERKENQKQEQERKWIDRDDLNIWKEVIDLSKQGRLFQSDEVLNLNVQWPISILILGVNDQYAYCVMVFHLTCFLSESAFLGPVSYKT